MKLGSTWGTTSQNINGLQGGDFMMNSKDSFGPRVAATFDGSSSQSRASEKKMNALAREQLFEDEVRLQIKASMAVFSKQMQNLFKRGIDYMSPLEKAAQV